MLVITWDRLRDVVFFVPALIDRATETLDDVLHCFDSAENSFGDQNNMVCVLIFEERDHLGVHTPIVRRVDGGAHAGHRCYMRIETIP